MSLSDVRGQIISVVLAATPFSGDVDTFTCDSDNSGPVRAVPTVASSGVFGAFDVTVSDMPRDDGEATPADTFRWQAGLDVRVAYPYSDGVDQAWAFGQMAGDAEAIIAAISDPANRGSVGIDALIVEDAPLVDDVDDGSGYVMSVPVIALYHNL